MYLTKSNFTYKLDNFQESGSKLPESDREDMEVFLQRIQQLLPVLGSELFISVAQLPANRQTASPLICRSKGAQAFGQRTPDGFVIFRGSTAVLQERPATLRRQPYLVALRKKLVEDGTLVEKDGFYTFTRDAEFSSPSAAASIVHGGGANGLTEWRTEHEKNLIQLDDQA